MGVGATEKEYLFFTNHLTISKEPNALAGKSDGHCFISDGCQFTPCLHLRLAGGGAMQITTCLSGKVPSKPSRITPSFTNHQSDDRGDIAVQDHTETKTVLENRTSK